MLQNWFDGPPVDVLIKPHGNSKGNTPFFRIAQSVRKRHREIAAVSAPTEAMQLATKESGGELEATGLQRLPRNLDQIKTIDGLGIPRMAMSYTVLCCSANHLKALLMHLLEMLRLLQIHNVCYFLTGSYKILCDF